jgi:hypothetical protein
MMTPKQFTETMQKLKEQYGGDTETFHVTADGLLCELLRELGYHEGIAIYEAEDRWYA